MLHIPELNIGIVGHVDHGKTTLVQALTGQWTARHSEELKRSMTIKLGYANGYLARCKNVEAPQSYRTNLLCPDGSEAEIIKSVSYVDAPGHEIFMATMLSGASLMDAAILVIAANEPCPQPQTREHLMALDFMGIDQVIIVQNKIDVITKEQAKSNYRQILDFLSTTKYSKAPIIPISALHGVNLDVLVMTMTRLFKTPERDLSRPAYMLVARSFDVNPPGTPPEKLVGGVIGGGLIRGEIKVGDEIEIKPGTRIVEKGSTRFEPLVTRVVSIKYGIRDSNRAIPGGLVAIGTSLDPSLTKADTLIGNIAGHSVPDPVNSLLIEYKLFERVVGTKQLEIVESIKPRENLMLTIGTAVRLGIVTKVAKDEIEVTTKEPVVIVPKINVAIARQVKGRWRLIGWGRIKS
ncbi:MAG: translation initiation factor IF-2 subunit gamma [Ignisphaera sp.]|uniref:protein-synthesizing GTPase n=1 Tax=Ignisphaera aggregans TaxID=334771 RepID=A0A832AN20_9CREN